MHGLGSKSKAKRKLVLKIGSSTLTNSDSSIDRAYMERLASQVDTLMRAGWQCVIVSSGAIACGLGLLGIETRPDSMRTLQAAASVGQTELASAYAEAFAKFGRLTSLVLLTRRDTADRVAYLHARDTFEELLHLDVIPVVNENDTVSVEQIRFGDNDSLAALVACLIDADLVVLASDIDGLYDADPSKSADARLLKTVSHIDERIIAASGGAGSAVGSGGMRSKVGAARVLMAAGIPMAVVDGNLDGAVVDTANGRCPGTLFEAADIRHTISPRKLWIALGDSSKGSIHIDDGAVHAISSKGASLLSVGARSVEGSFDIGDIVDIMDMNGMVLARGRAMASSDEIKLALGHSREELADNRILAHLADSPIVHRDELIVFD